MEPAKYSNCKLFRRVILVWLEWLGVPSSSSPLASCALGFLPPDTLSPKPVTENVVTLYHVNNCQTGYALGRVTTGSPDAGRERMGELLVGHQLEGHLVGGAGSSLGL